LLVGSQRTANCALALRQSTHTIRKGSQWIVQ
jgi:hypothetical protein